MVVKQTTTCRAWYPQWKHERTKNRVLGHVMGPNGSFPGARLPFLALMRSLLYCSPCRVDPHWALAHAAQYACGNGACTIGYALAGRCMVQYACMLGKDESHNSTQKNLMVVSVRHWNSPPCCVWLVRTLTPPGKGRPWLKGPFICISMSSQDSTLTTTPQVKWCSPALFFELAPWESKRPG